MADFKQEIDALQRMVWTLAGLTSVRQAAAPPQVARPIVLWEAPGRTRSGHIGRYAYTNRVTQYGKLYAHNLDSLLTLQDKLQQGMEGLDGIISVYDKEGPLGVVVGYLRNPEIEFSHTDGLDVPFFIRYSRNLERANKPVPAPAAVTVTTRQNINP